MISNIIDSNGFLVYKGNDVDEKFSRVLSREGHSRVDVDHHEFEKPKWDGTKWTEGETDLEVWKKKMAESDVPLPRWGEDLIDLTSGAPTYGAISPQTQKLADDKKALRSERP